MKYPEWLKDEIATLLTWRKDAYSKDNEQAARIETLYKRGYITRDELKNLFARIVTAEA